MTPNRKRGRLTKIKMRSKVNRSEAAVLQLRENATRARETAKNTPGRNPGLDKLADQAEAALAVGIQRLRRVRGNKR